MKDIPGKFLGLLLAFFLCVIAPLVNIVTQQDMLTRRQIVTEMSNFIDEVIDSRAYYPTMRKELITRLNSYGVTVTFKVIKEQRSVDASVVSSSSGLDAVEGSADVSFVTVPLEDLGENDVIHFETGDRVGIEVMSMSYSGIQYIVHELAGVFLPKFEYRLYARVR